MNFLLVGVVLIGVIADTVVADGEQCGKLTNPVSRIFPKQPPNRGKQALLTALEVLPSTLPWLVSLKLNGKHECTGVLIQDPKNPYEKATDLVLIPGVCMADESKALDEYRVAVSAHLIGGCVECGRALHNHGEEDLKIAAIYPDRSAQPDSPKITPRQTKKTAQMAEKIAGQQDMFIVIKLEKILEYSNSSRPICFANDETNAGEVKGGPDAVLGGWGDVSIQNPTKIPRGTAPVTVTKVRVVPSDRKCKVDPDKSNTNDYECTVGCRYSDIGSPLMTIDFAKKQASLRGMVVGTGKDGGIVYAGIETRYGKILQAVSQLHPRTGVVN